MTKNETKKNRRRRKIFLAVIMILFTGVVLTASTYAWFTANRTVTVESIDVNVSTSEGLQISTDATTWKAIVTNSDITGASWTGVRNQIPTGTGKVAVPVSTIGNVDANGLMEMYKGTVESNAATGNNILISEKSTETHGLTGDFVAFDLFFQSNSTQDVYLTSNSKVVAKTGTTSTGIENAARVAFIKEGNVASGSAATSAQILKGNLEKLIWEPNYDSHTDTAIANASSVYGLSITDGSAKLAYNGVSSEFAAGDNVALNATTAGKFSSVTTVGSLSTGIPTTAYIKAFTVPAGITKVRIYMWIEGQDVDCEDHASGGSITYNLQFSIDDHA